MQVLCGRAFLPKKKYNENIISSIFSAVIYRRDYNYLVVCVLVTINLRVDEEENVGIESG